MKKAILALADGTVFHGKSIGATGSTVGEVVFNTSMTGYQEIITDPSYASQIITLTYPHIGNVGVNKADWESREIFSAGLIVRDASIVYSSWRGEESLNSFLDKNDVVAIAGIDTRKLTRLLRDKGAQNGCIITGDNPSVDEAISKAQAFGGLKNCDLAKEVSIANSFNWQNGGEYELSANGYSQNTPENFHVVAYDFGVKNNIFRMLAERGCKITVVPAQTSADEVLALKPNGIFLSNGPGDPEPCDYAIAATKTFLEQKIPTFGICLGMQIMSLAAGAGSLKMKFGHHGANHPVECVKSKRVFITSQNHGFAIDESSLPDNVEITHRSLFDGSLQGIAFTDRPAFSFQGHPEASPGPQDIDELFDHFITLMQQAHQQTVI